MKMVEVFILDDEAWGDAIDSDAEWGGLDSEVAGHVNEACFSDVVDGRFLDDELAENGCDVDDGA